MMYALSCLSPPHASQHDVIYPEYKKFFDSHPALEGDAAKVTVRLVPKADVIEYARAYSSRCSCLFSGSDGKKTYVPKPENKSVRDAPSKAHSHALEAIPFSHRVGEHSS